MPESYQKGITDFIFAEDQPEKSDIIFIPGGNYPQAALQAARLYHQGYAPLLLPSGKYSILDSCFAGDYETEWDYLSSILIRQGVPAAAVLKENQAAYTYENAVYSRRVLDQAGIRPMQAILVCQAFHARRSLMYYQEQFPETRLLVCPVETRGISRDNWHLSPEKIDVVLGEVERCGSQFHTIMKQSIYPETEQ